MARNLSTDYWAANDVGDIVANGSDESGMPGYGSRVTGTDIRNLTAYLDSLGRSGEPRFTH